MTRQHTDWPLYWLAVLEQAVRDGGYAAALEAQQHLRRLGLDVVIRLTPPASRLATEATHPTR